jgi:hypothetical protein
MNDQLGFFEEPVVAAPQRWSYCRRSVPPWACDRALHALAVYNDATGQSLGAFRHNGAPSDHLTRITGAVLDHPDVTREQWDLTVRAALRSPWWTGPASVGVVFGPAVIDRNIAGAVAEPGVRASGVRQTANGALLRALEHPPGTGLPAGA